MNLAPKIGSIIALCALTACAPSEPKSPKAGDYVYLVIGLGRATPGRTSLVSVYETTSSYGTGRTPKGAVQISGKRMRFRVDHSLVTSSTRRQGPHVSVGINYDFATGGPAGGGADNVIANVGRSQVGGNLTPENIVRSAAPFETIGVVPAGGLVRRDTPVCNLDAYDVTIPGDRERPHATGFGGAKAQRFRDRFGHSMVFGIQDSHGRYTDVINCPQYFPTCQAITSYRGWPVRIVFGSDNICAYPQIAAHVRMLYDRFYIDETDRSPGQEDRLWFPAEIRKDLGTDVSDVPER